MSENRSEMGEGLGGRLAHVKGRIEAACARAGREVGEVELVSVSKRKPLAMIREAAAAGARVFGENYAQELKQKADELGGEAGVEWHFIGSIQRNKVKYLVGRAALLHAVDSIRVVDEIQKRASGKGLVQPVLVELSLAGEESKAGVAEEELGDLLAHFANTPAVRCVGLMTMPPWVDDQEEVRPYFRRLRELRDRWRDRGLVNVDLHHLSMGMTQDFEAAVEEGATLVRVGTAIFGARQ